MRTNAGKKTVFGIRNRFPAICGQVKTFSTMAQIENCVTNTLGELCLALSKERLFKVHLFSEFD